MSLTMVLYYWDLLFGLYPSSLCFFKPQHFKGQLIEASVIDRTQQSSFHLRTREEPSLEMLWFKKHKDDGQVPDPSKQTHVGQTHNGQEFDVYKSLEI
jgi:hypothetical protein